MGGGQLCLGVDSLLSPLEPALEVTGGRRGLGDTRVRELSASCAQPVPGTCVFTEAADNSDRDCFQPVSRGIPV